MRIISIDPGYERLGIAIIEKIQGKKESLIYSECFKTRASLPHAERLSLIQIQIESILKQYDPKDLAIETLFFSSNQKTGLKVAEARGVVISVCKTRGLEVFEYGPGQIKLAVTGYGKSDKGAIIKMIPQLINISEKKQKGIAHDDEYDAIAVGLTHTAIKIFK